MAKFGPTKGELKVRLIICMLGLGMIVTALVRNGIPEGPALFEMIGVGGLFFGLSAVWVLRKLIRKDYSDAPKDGE